MHKNTSIIYNQ